MQLKVDSTITSTTTSNSSSTKWEIYPRWVWIICLNVVSILPLRDKV